MSRGMQTSRLIGAALIVVTAVAYLGCGRHTDLSEYHRASDVKRDESAAPVASADSVAVVEEKTEESAAATSQELPQSVEPTPETKVAEADFLPASALVPVNAVDGGSVRGLMSIPSETQPLAPNDKSAATVKAGSPADLPVEPKTIELLIKDKAFRPEPKTGALRVSFDDLDLLKVLNMEPVVENADQLMPDWLKGLDGKLVRLRGFMYPTFDTEGIEHFVLARDNQICCFGRDPKVYDLVQIDMKAGKTTNYIPATRAFDVIGKFKIEMLSEEGKPYGLYSIEQADVIDK